MSAQWFLTQLPASRFAIESEIRIAFWKAGYGDIWVTCTKDDVPYQCEGFLKGKQFAMEWDPKSYVMLKTAEPNQELLGAFERALKHRATVAYKDVSGQVVVEWRARNAEARLQELQNSGVAELEKLS